jgi:hypothetical protein
MQETERTAGVCSDGSKINFIELGQYGDKSILYLLGKAENL